MIVVRHCHHKLDDNKIVGRRGVTFCGERSCPITTPRCGATVESAVLYRCCAAAEAPPAAALSLHS